MDLAHTFISRSRYYLQNEYRTKIRAAVEALPPDAIWWRANDQSNSVGNLLLHLAGNIRQWIVAGVGRQPDRRNRDSEFAARGGADAAQLLDALEQALDEVDAVIASLAPDDLASRRTIQGREISVLEAVYHVVEHFAGHTYQIILMAKMHAPGAVRFYEDAGGLARPIWPGLTKS